MSAPPAPPRRVLLVQLQRLGDVLLTTPLLDDLHRAFPGAQLDFLVGQGAAPLLEHHSCIAERLVYDTARPRRTWRAVRGRRYDWVLDVQSNPRTAPVTLISGARVRVGWRITGPWKLAYTHTVPRSGLGTVYVPVERQRFLHVLGVPTEPPAARLYLTDEERALGESEARALGAPAGRPRAGFVLSANLPAREWAVERFAGAARALSADGAVPLVFHNPGDDSKIAEFRRLVPAAVVAHTPGVREMARVIAACEVLISGDTGPGHIARALSVPTVTVYGPSDPAHWNPGLPTTAIARAPAGVCRCPRQVKACPTGHECMTAVTPAMVAGLARAYLFASQPEESR